MNQQFGSQFDQAQKFFNEVGNVQAIAEQSVTVSKELYDKTAAAMQDGTKTLTEIADTAWGSTKMLNEKFAYNVMANFEVMFTAARAMATAKSLPEAAKVQSEFLQRFASQATEQAREFLDLSARATQHMLEKTQAAGTRWLKSGR